MAELPHGTVAFLFTDVEGSTRLWQAHPEAMHRAYVRHDAILHGAVARHGGVLYKTIGDAFQAAFSTAPDAVAAAAEAQLGMVAEGWDALGLPEPLRVRTALHAGAVEPDEHGDYRSPVLNRLGRLLGAAHGGQVLLSQAAFELARDHLPNGAGLRDLGEQRLKDLGRPERVWQLLHPGLPAEFPPLATLARTPNNLPAQPTALIGRERELGDVRALLERNDVRLVTLTGPGGVGKTRLALQAAADLLDAFTDGCWFVDLAPVTDPALVPSAVAAALAVREAGGRSLAEALAAYLKERRLLLVLDNVEQVVAAAPFVAGLLAAAPGLEVLATSRIRLGLRAEHEYAVKPLALPDPRRPPPLPQLTQYEAVRLFIERAVAARADFAVTNETAPAVAEICHRLEGLPLAIELAAARVKLFGPAALLARLERRLPFLTGGARDLPARQRTLRDAVAWSHDLLTAEEQALFRRLGVFAGGCTFEAAEAVVGPAGELDVFTGLATLVDHSLLRQEEETAPGGIPSGNPEPRLRMLETIREFALEQLEASGEGETVRRRHAAWALAFAEAGDRLEAEHDNLRAALTWALAGNDTVLAVQLAARLRNFWYVGGHWSEGRAWLERALAVAADPPATDRAALLHGAGTLAFALGDYDAAAEMLEESLALYRTAGDPRAVATLLDRLGVLARERGDLAAAAERVEEALELARAEGDEQSVAHALNELGIIARRRGELAQAVELHEAALAAQRAIGNQVGVTNALQGLAGVRALMGDTGGAVACLEEALPILRDLGIRSSTAYALNNLAGLVAGGGDLPRAVALYEEALVFFRELGETAGIALVLTEFGETLRDTGDLARAFSLYQECLTLNRRLGRPRMVAIGLRALASVAALDDEGARAARLLGAAEGVLATTDEISTPGEAADHQALRAELERRLGRDAFSAAFETGRRLTLDEAVAEALAVPPPQAGPEVIVLSG